MRKVRRSFFVTMGQILLVALIFAFVAYRIALILDLVPEGFSPGGVAKEELIKFKVHLQEDAQSDDLTSYASLLILTTMDNIEASYQRKQVEDAAEEKVEARCGENDIYRFFMYLGSDKNHPMTCTPVNLQINNAIKDLHTKAPAATATTTGTNGKGPRLAPSGSVTTPITPHVPANAAPTTPTTTKQ